MHETASNTAVPLLIEIVDALTLEPDFEVFFSKAAASIRSLLQADGSALILLDEVGGMLEYRLFEGNRQAMLNPFRGFRFPSREGVAGLALREKRSVHVADYLAEPTAMPVFKQAGLRSNLVIPLIVADRAVGVLAASWFDRPCTSLPRTNLALAERVAAQIAVACDRMRLESRLRELAHTDVLTGLASRRAIMDALDVRLAQFQRYGRPFALFLMDVDGLKSANDAWGHEIGDNLLKDAGQRMAEALRRGDRVGRLGGDEFLVIAECGEWEVEHLAQRLLQAMRIRFGWGRARGRLSASIGIAVCPQDGDDATTLLRRADMAMYQAKAAGGDGYRRFDPELEGGSGRRALSAELSEALERGELCLWYQPLVRLADMRVQGFEALLRWRRPDGELLSAGAFINAVESAPGDLVYRLGSWVLWEAARQIGRWREQGQGFDVHVNVSARHFLHPSFLSELRHVLTVSPQVAAHLILEITETTVLDDLDRADRIMKACRGLGVRVAIDDFGTGYTSLTYLKRLPLDLIKIDRSFVAELEHSSIDQGIVRGVISIAHSLGLPVVAEGAEIAAQIDTLQELGCDQLQGYAVSRPMPIDALDAWLSEWEQDRPCEPACIGG